MNSQDVIKEIIKENKELGNTTYKSSDLIHELPLTDRYTFVSLASRHIRQLGDNAIKLGIKVLDIFPSSLYDAEKNEYITNFYAVCSAENGNSNIFPKRRIKRIGLYTDSLFHNFSQEEIVSSVKEYCEEKKLIFKQFDSIHKLSIFDEGAGKYYHSVSTFFEVE